MNVNQNLDFDTMKKLDYSLYFAECIFWNYILIELVLWFSDATSYHNRDSNGSYRRPRETIQTHGLIKINKHF